jgi:hypothetical protein
MTKHKSRRISKSKAIQNALGQLGWHTSGKDVTAFLANLGIEVNEGLVQKVKVDSIKSSGAVERKMAKVKVTDQRPAAAFVRRVPKQRSYRRQ